MLTLPEELMLLALDDQQGTVVPNAREPLQMGLASAILTELTLTGKLRFDGQQNVIVANPAPTGDALLDETLDRIARTAPPRPALYWLQTLPGQLRDMEGRLIQRLVQRGALRVEESRRMIFLKETRFPQGVAGFEHNIKNRLREVVLHNAPPDERTLALIGLIKMTNLIETVFPFTEWDQARRRIDELTSPQFAGWQYQGQPGHGYEPQPMDMMSGFVPVLLFSMLAQNMFWGMGGWMMPGLAPGLMGMGDPMQDVPLEMNEGLTEVGNMDDAGGLDFGGFDFGGDI